MKREKMCIRDLIPKCKETILTCNCSNCGTIFFNLTNKQLELINYIRENKQLEIIATEKHYYPTKYSDWGYVLQKQNTNYSDKFQNETYFVYDEKYYNINENRCDNVLYANNFDLFSEFGILSYETESSAWRNINDNDINPKTNEISHSYDVDIRNIVTFSDNFQNFENEYGKVYFMTYDEFYNSSKCPVCDFLNYKSNLIRTFKRMNDLREKNKEKSLKLDYGVVPIFKELINKFEEKQFGNEYECLVQKYEKEIKNNSNITQKCEKGIDFDLTTFLESLVNCEKNKRILIDILKEQVKSYHKNKMSLERKKKIIISQFTKNINNEIERINQNIEKLNNKIELDEKELIDNNIEKPIKPIKPEKNNINKPQKPILRKAGLFNKTRIAIENQNLLKSYELDLKEYEEKEQKYQEDIQEYNKLYSKYEESYKIFQRQYKDLKEKISNEKENKIKKLKKEIDKLNEAKNNIEDSINTEIRELPEMKICEYLLKEIDEIKNELIEINIAINQLNALNIIYPKYNTFIAVTTFYEYFLTGRCDSLTGSSGAYNLYESELRSNIIIDKLDTIIEKLDSIKENQYQMYCVLNEIKETQEEICSLIDKVVYEITEIGKNTKNIEELSSVTAYNTTKIAYYSQINNKMLKTIGMLVTLK
jgi:hypothetical protein